MRWKVWGLTSRGDLWVALDNDGGEFDSRPVWLRRHGPLSAAAGSGDQIE